MITFVNYNFCVFIPLKCGILDSLGGSSSGSGGGGDALAGAILGSAIAGEATKDAANTAADANLKATESTNQTNMQNWREQREYDYSKWKEMLEYNTPANQVKRYQDAGINPALAMSNIDSGVVTSTAGGQQTPTLQAPQYDVATMAMANSAPLRGIIEGMQSGSNYLLTMEQVKSQSLENTKRIATMMDEVNSLHYDTETKRMSKELFDATLEDNIQMVKQQRLQSYIKTSTDSLLQVGTEYQVGMQRFDFLNLKPLEKQALEQGLAQTCAEISLTWAKRKLTLQQVDNLINEKSLGWSRLGLDWFSAKNQNRNMLNSEWNANQSTYRENYKFNKTKDLFRKQIKLGVDLLQQEYNTNNDTYSSWTYNLGQHGRNLLGGWLPLSGSFSKAIK